MPRPCCSICISELRQVNNICNHVSKVYHWLLCCCSKGCCFASCRRVMACRLVLWACKSFNRQLSRIEGYGRSNMQSGFEIHIQNISKQALMPLHGEHTLTTAKGCPGWRNSVGASLARIAWHSPSVVTPVVQPPCSTLELGINTCLCHATFLDATI